MKLKRCLVYCCCTTLVCFSISYLYLYKALENVSYTNNPKAFGGNIIFSHTQLSISFKLCNGFTNQLLGLKTGLMIAFLMQANVYLPKFILDGTEGVDAVDQLEIGRLDLVFDEIAIKHLFKNEYFSVVDNTVPKTMPTETFSIARKRQNPQYYKSLANKLRSKNVAHVSFDCALFALDAEQFNKREVELFWKIESMLVASNYVNNVVEKIVNKIKLKHKSNHYNALHLRIENDWDEHCNKWENIPDNIIRENCMGNFNRLYDTLRMNDVDLDTPIYIATWMSLGNLTRKITSKYPGMTQFMNGYKVELKETLFDKYELSALSHYMKYREFSAAVDYAVCKNSRVFVGNRVSTMSATLLLSRFRQHKSAISYNDEDIPLAAFYASAGQSFYNRIIEKPPNQRNGLRWIFALHPNGDKYQLKMVKVAVLSALKNTDLRPTCIYTGDKGDKIVQWLVDHGVYVIYHRLSWSFIFPLRMAVADKHRSHLSNNSDMMHGTFLRVDIPILGIPEKFVLYTDTDVIFMHKINLGDFLVNGKPPQVFACGAEVTKTKNTFPCNAGVMFLNVNYMRRTHQNFIKYIQNHRNILVFEDSPGDQGALNAYYKGKLSSLRLELNWKPYWGYNKNAKIVHMHGPKCLDYDIYFKENKIHRPLFADLLLTCADAYDCYKYCELFHKYLENA